MSVEISVQLNRSSRRVLMAALGAITIVGLYRWILWPYNGQLMAAQRYESSLDDAERKIDLLCTTLEAKKVKAEELEKETQRLRNELFAADEVRWFFSSLPTIAQQSGCVIQSVSAPPETRGNGQNQPDRSGITSKKTSLLVVGGYNNIIMLLDKLANSQRRVWIESVRIDAGGNTGKLQCQAVITIYCIERLEIAFYE